MNPEMTLQNAEIQPPATRPWALIAVLCAVAFFAVVASMLGGSVATLASAVFVLLSGSVAPGLYLLGSLGLGVLVQKAVWPGCQRVWSLRAGLGLGAMLTVTHLMGVLGVLTVRGVALVPVALGAAVIIGELLKLRGRRIEPRVSWVWLAATPATGVLLVAACSPPGWLWASEFGGYDVLSYHLELPKEWLATGRVWPLEHNVYSYLPSFMEAAFLHVGVMMGAVKTGLTSGDGSMLAAGQFLHAGIAIIAAMTTTSAASEVLKRTDDERAQILAPIAGGLVIATPWSVVTGSMAYNEMAVLALFATALVAALSGELKPIRRGLVVGVLVGAACGCKPTALIFCAPACGLAMVWDRPKKTWAMLTLGACFGGLVMILPWLVRNWMAGGNPVFPQLSGIFGSAHWSAEQIERYKAGHSFEGSFFEALRLFVLPESGGAHRGILHGQWAFFGPMVLICSVGALAIRRTHRVAALVALMLLMQLAVWLLLTHVQSRFLMPMLVPGAIAVAVGLSCFPVRHLALTLGTLCVLVQSVVTLLIFSLQQADLGGPNVATLFGPGLYASAPADTPSDQLSPIAFLNERLPEGSKVLVVGDAAVLYIEPAYTYATTWDTSPMLGVIKAHEDPAEWSPSLREMGYTHVYADLSELDRLALAGWSDPMLDAGWILNWLAQHATPMYRDEAGNRLIFELP